MWFLDLASYVLADYLSPYPGLYGVFLWICLALLITPYFHLLHFLYFFLFLHVVFEYSISLSENIVLLLFFLHLFLHCLHYFFQITDLFGQIIDLSGLFFNNAILICHFLLIEINSQLFGSDLACKLIVLIDKLLHYIETAIFIIFFCLHHHV